MINENSTKEEIVALCWEGAANAIETYGWIRHKGGSPEEGFCMIGAAAFSFRPFVHEGVATMLDFFAFMDKKITPLMNERYGMSLHRANDTRVQNQEEAVALCQEISKL